MGGAQPLAATMAGACFLGIDVDAEAHQEAPEDRLLRLLMVNSPGRSAAHPEERRAPRKKAVSGRN